MAIQAQNNNRKFGIVVRSSIGDGRPQTFDVDEGDTVGTLLGALTLNARDVTVSMDGVNATSGTRLVPNAIVTITPNKQAGASR